MREAWRFAVLQSGLDDSGKDGLSPAFVLAGYIASDQKMMNFSHAWDDLLNKPPKLNYIKGYEAFGLKDEFEGWKREDRDKRLLESVQLIKEHLGHGIAFVIDNKPFTLIENLPDAEGVQFSDAFEFAYVASLSTLLQVLPEFGETKIDAVFDFDLITRRQAKKAYRRIFQKWPDLAKSLYRPEPHWETDQQFIPLQAADLLAYCVRTTRETDPTRDKIRDSPVLPAIRSIPTVLAYIDEQQCQYLRDRLTKNIPRQEVFKKMRW
jgi:hypothetical protein